MAKKKVSGEQALETQADQALAAASEVPAENEAEKVEAGVADLQAKIDALEAENAKLRKAGDEAGFDRVARALGQDPNELRAAEKAQDAEPELMEYDIGPSVVRINGQTYTGSGITDRHTAEGIIHMAAARRQRLLREMVGHEGYLQEIQGGGFRMRVVKKYNDVGDRITG